MTDDEGFSERLKRCRVELGMTKSDLAKASGVAAAQIYRYETGKSKPREDIVAKLAKALKVTNEWLIFGQDDFALQPLSLRSRPNALEVESPIEALKNISNVLNQTEQIIKALHQENSTLSERIENPFSKIQINQMSGQLNQADFIISRFTDSINSIIQHSTEIDRSIKEHEKEYLLMKRLDKLDEYFKEQRKIAAYNISYIIPKEMATELLEISSKEEADAAFEGFTEWCLHMMADVDETDIPKKETYARIVDALNYLMMIAHITNASLPARSAIGRLAGFYLDIIDQ